MQAKISIQLIALDKTTKQSHDLVCVYVFIYSKFFEVHTEQISQGSRNHSVCVLHELIPRQSNKRGQRTGNWGESRNPSKKAELLKETSGFS